MESGEPREAAFSLMFRPISMGNRQSRRSTATRPLRYSRTGSTGTLSRAANSLQTLPES